MPHPPPIASQVLAATVDNCTLVAVSGAATFKLAPAFKRAVQAARLAGSALIVIDMAGCLSMDSTFMGAIAGLGFAIRKGDGQLALINLSPHAAGLLNGLGVDRILKIYPAAALPEGLGDLSLLEHSLRPIATEPTGNREMAALMYDAHETLVRVDAKNLQRFKDVLAFLREDLKRFKG